MLERMPALTAHAFMALAGPHCAELSVHCYRMLGSPQDAEEALQETLARAWCRRSSLGSETLARAWLYRIATNVCLDELDKKARRRPLRGVPFADADSIEGAVGLASDPVRTMGGDEDPEAHYSSKQSVSRAFVVALSALTPSRRAALLLRDVVGLSARETADALGTSVEAVNSSLFRARAALEPHVSLQAAEAGPAATPEIDELMLARYVRAWEAGKHTRLSTLLRDELAGTPTSTAHEPLRGAVAETHGRVLLRDARWPILEFTFPTQFTVEDVAATYAFWDTVLDRGPHAVLVNFERLNPLFDPPRLRQAVVSEVEKRRSAFERNLVAEARVVIHPVMRGLVNAFDWVIGNSFSRPLMNCASVAEAEQFLRSKLAERGVIVARSTAA